MSNLAKADTERSQLIERVAITGDLGKLSAQERVEYYSAVCTSLGLNPLTRPFDYLQLNGKLTLYANKGCTDQLRNIQRVSVEIVKRDHDDDLQVYTVTARATKPNGRVDEDVGSVTIKNCTGDQLANAMMKAHTKAKRRVTLSICGLSVLDESELETVPHALRVQVDPETGELLNAVPQISPHGHAEPGEVFDRTEEECDAIVLGIQNADTLPELASVFETGAWVTPEEMEQWDPAHRKTLSAAYQRRKRQLEKARRAPPEPVVEGDDL